MTDNELKDYFKNRELPTGLVTFSAFESAFDLKAMVTMALDNIEGDGQRAAVSREVLHRLIAYLEGDSTKPAGE